MLRKTLARAIPFAPSGASGHSEFAPHRRQLILRNANQIDSLAAGQFDQRNLVFHGDLGDAHQFIGLTYASRHLRYDRECTIFLDIAMDAVIDEASVAFILILIVPNRCEQGGERRLARGILGAARKRPEHGGHGLEVLFAKRCDELRLGKRNARDVVMDRRVFLDLTAAKPL